MDVAGVAPWQLRKQGVNVAFLLALGNQKIALNAACVS